MATITALLAVCDRAMASEGITQGTSEEWSGYTLHHTAGGCRPGHLAVQEEEGIIVLRHQPCKLVHMGGSERQNFVPASNCGV